MGSVVDLFESAIVIATVCLNLFLMFVVMAINAQQFPIAAIGWVVVVVVVAMVHGQFAQIGVGEFPSAATADPRIDLEGFFAVAFFTLVAGFSGTQNNLIKAFVVDGTHEILAKI